MNERGEDTGKRKFAGIAQVVGILGQPPTSYRNVKLWSSETKCQLQVIRILSPTILPYTFPQGAISATDVVLAV